MEPSLGGPNYYKSKGFKTKKALVIALALATSLWFLYQIKSSQNGDKTENDQNMPERHEENQELPLLGRKWKVETAMSGPIEPEDLQMSEAFDRSNETEDEFTIGASFEDSTGQIMESREDEGNVEEQKGEEMEERIRLELERRDQGSFGVYGPNGEVRFNDVTGLPSEGTDFQNSNIDDRRKNETIIS